MGKVVANCWGHVILKSIGRKPEIPPISLGFIFLVLFSYSFSILRWQDTIPWEKWTHLCLSVSLKIILFTLFLLPHSRRVKKHRYFRQAGYIHGQQILQILTHPISLRWRWHESRVFVRHLKILPRHMGLERSSTMNQDFPSHPNILSLT